MDLLKFSGLKNVLLFRVILGVTWTYLLYIYIYRERERERERERGGQRKNRVGLGPVGTRFFLLFVWEMLDFGY